MAKTTTEATTPPPPGVDRSGPAGGEAGLDLALDTELKGPAAREPEPVLTVPSQAFTLWPWESEPVPVVVAVKTRVGIRESAPN